MEKTMTQAETSAGAQANELAWKNGQLTEEEVLRQSSGMGFFLPL